MSMPHPIAEGFSGHVGVPGKTSGFIRALIIFSIVQSPRQLLSIYM